jgi:uncharacterized protein
MKYLLVLVVVGLGLWVLLRGRRPAAGEPAPKRARRGKAPAPMVPCAHCGLHLPASDAVTDAAGRTFCTDAHRLAGPR